MGKMSMLCVAGALSLGCLATTYYVKPDGSDSAAGTSWEKAFKTPNKGFNIVHNKSANHEVVIAAGTYQLTDACRCAGPTQDTGKRVVIRGETGNPEDVVLMGNDTFEIVRLSRCVTVSGLTISHGSNSNRTNRAAGVRVGSTDPGISIVSNCIITACHNAYTNHTRTADNKREMFGGPVYVYPNGLLVDCVVSNNSSIYYGCGVTLDGAGATALRCRIEGNVSTETENSGVPVLGVTEDSTWGGRLVDCVVQSNLTAYCAGARNVLWVEGCTFRGNVLAADMSAHSSPGMAIGASGVVVTNCTFVDNRADNGYATVYVTQRNVRILDSRFIGNSVYNYGGAISFSIGASAGVSTVSGCLFDGNSVAQGSNKGGGAIRVDAGNIEIANCTFTNNAAPFGGAVDLAWTATSGGNPNTATQAHAAFTNCLFVGNSAKSCGGAIRVARGAQVVLNDCRIIGNRTTFQNGDEDQGGGGVFLYQQQAGGSCVASNSVFAGNSSALRSGGLGNSWNNYAFGAVVNCVFTNNTALRQGGGLTIRENDSHKHADDPFVVRNCLFAFNKTTDGGNDSNGGGIHFVSYNDVVLDSCTVVSNNSGYTMNGGVHHRWGGTITNCVIAFNTVKGKPEPVTTSSSGAWQMDASCYQNCCIWPAVPGKFTAASGCVNADPLFVDAANGDFTLRPGSPCRNVGVLEDWMADATDLAGSPRVSGKGVDMGCYELFTPSGLNIIVR